MTIIIGAIRLREADIEHPDGRLAVVADLARMAAEYRATWTGLTRGRHLAGMTWRGCLELAVERQIKPGSHCATTLAAMGLDTAPLASDERILILHSHLVIAADIGGAVHDARSGEAWARHVRAVLRRTWPGSRRIRVQGLWTETIRTIPESISELCKYVRKQRLEYTDGDTGWGGVPTRYAGPFEWSWSKLVGTAYRDIRLDLRSRR